MGGKRVKPIDLDSVLAEILDDYADNITEAVKETVDTVTKTAKKEVQKDSPVRKKGGGAYKKGWAVQKSGTRFGANAIVYNRTQYQLTHLLEKGHAKRNGGRVKPIVHIAPVEERAVEAVKKAIEKITGE